MGSRYRPEWGDLWREKGFGVWGVEGFGGGVMMLVEAEMGMGVCGGKRVKKLRRRGGRVRARAI